MAMAHNTQTVRSDMDFFKKLLTARKEFELLRAVEEAERQLTKAYAAFLEVYGEEVAAEVMDAEGRVPADEPAGNERRSLVEVARHDAGLARRFQTR
jgi:hypothetical protein